MASHGVALAAGETPADATPDLERLRAFATEGSPGPHVHVVLLGLSVFESHDVLRAINKGLPYRVLERLARNTGLSIDAILGLIDVPRRTLTRRKAEGRFLPAESDRLIRVSRLFAQALALFESDRDAARGWLAAPQPALGRLSPLDLARTEVGVREVERLIARLEHGVFS